MTPLPLLRFAPLYQERVWGGRALASALGRTLPAGDRPIGESWELVDRPEAQSRVVGGPWAGQSLRAVIAADPAGVMGPGWAAARPFPILVKWLDCRERLSLQVHPPAAVAGELRGEPKTENWYLAECQPGAHLIVGLRRGVTREAFAAGDSILVRSGQLHAIDGGNLILEIQQNSDTTYRVYDWGRVGLDGRPRQLHVEESLRSILWDDVEPTPRRAGPGSAVLADAPEFRLRRVALAPGESLRLAAGDQPRILSVVAGRLEGAGEPLRRGDNLLAPYAGAFALTASEGATVLVTENFAG